MLKLYTQVPLVRAFSVCANGYCYVSWEINRFLKSLWVVSIKNAGFSKLETQFSCFETRFIRGSSIVPVLSRHATLLLSRPDLSRKIDGPLLAGYKLINNNNFKDRSFQWYLILDILTNPVRVTLTKKGNINFWGEINCQFRCLHTTLWRLICPFPKTLASQNSMQNKDDKVGNKTDNKQERQRKKREQERKIEIDSPKKVQILAFAHAWKTKKLFNYTRLVKKHAFFLAKLFFSLSYANQPKTSPIKVEELVKNVVFSLLDGRH